MTRCPQVQADASTCEHEVLIGLPLSLSLFVLVSISIIPGRYWSQCLPRGRGPPSHLSSLHVYMCGIVNSWGWTHFVKQLVDSCREFRQR
jgi:hypothetical protein